MTVADVKPPEGLAPAARTRAVVRGSVWLIVTGVLSRALGVVGTLVLTHLVAPDAYGEVSDASVVAFTMNVIASVGVGIYVIANPNAPPRDRFHATVIHLVLGALFIIPLPLFGGPLGRLFGAPTMGRYLPGMVVAVMLTRVSLLPERMMVSRMRFGVISMERAGGELLYTLVSVLGAAAGMGAMAVVAGNVARAGLRLVVLVALVSWRDWLQPCRLRLETFARIVRFGWPVSLGQTIGFALRRWDNLIVSWMYGAAVVGAYNLAYNLADIPAVQIGEQITEALQVSFAGEQNSDSIHRLLRSVSVLAFIMTPMAVGLGAIAPTLADLFLDKRWSGAGPMLVWLSVISFPRPLSGAVASYMQVRNGRRAFLTLEAFTLATLLGSLLTIGRWGPLAACVAVGATFILRLAFAAVLLWRLNGVPMGAFFRPQLPPLLASLIMAAAVVATRLGLQASRAPLLLSLSAQLTVGVAFYAIAARLLAPATWRDAIALIRRTAARGRGKPAAPALG